MHKTTFIKESPDYLYMIDLSIIILRTNVEIHYKLEKKVLDNNSNCDDYKTFEKMTNPIIPCQEVYYS